MKELKFITNGEPHHKPKVFFTCHPDDYGMALPLISEDILRHSNCVIWYSDEDSIFESQEEAEALLEDMQLLTVAVTDRFLSRPNEAKDVILPLALSSHIPVLPIMLETGLEWRFNEVCAEVQLVNRYVSDPTATPYDDVLKTFLNSVLVSDELAQKVRSAFDAYVFLSYRKKDRRHAKRLMRMIHENKEFRDIAIWYDEYLVPGEDFNNAIKDAFNKSSLFALAVTQNLLEEGNYVKEVEYKIARTRYQEAHPEKPELETDDKFEIVPVELYKNDENDPKKDDPRVDRDELKRDYEDIPEVTDEDEKERVNDAFISALERIGKKANDGTSTHRFFIGIAYLCGIDVEPNFDRALELLTSAAEDKEEPCYEATEKLVDMYINGEGVAPNAYEARKWQTRLMEQYKAEYEKNYSPDEHRGFGTKYFKAMLKLSDLYRQASNIEKAIEWATEADRIAFLLEKEVGVREAKRDWAMAANRLGDLYRSKKDYDKTISYYMYAKEIYKEFVSEIATARAKRDLSVTYERLGDVIRKMSLDNIISSGQMWTQKYRGHLAGEDYQQAYEIRKELFETSGKPSARRDLSAILTKLGNLRMDNNDIDGAEMYYQRALEHDKILSEELKTNQSKDDYAVSLMKLGKVFRAKDEYDRAIDNYLTAKDIYKKLRESSCLPRYQNNYAACCEKLASAYKHSGDPEKAEEAFLEAIAVREAMDSGMPDDSHALAVSFFNYAAFKEDKAYFEKARAIWEKLSIKHPAYKRYLNKADKILAQL